MNTIESGTASTTGLDGSVAAASTAGTTTPTTTAGAITSTSSASATTATTAASVSPELQASKEMSQTTAANKDQFSVLSKVVDALVGVLTALVGLVSSLVGQLKGTSTNTSNGANNANGTTGAAGSNTGSTGTTGGTTGQASGTGTNQAGTVVRSALDVNKSEAGMITVRTLDGFTLRAEGRDQAWSITGPDGKTTRIWGDPHVSESDGDKWDFLNRSTFMFGKNKATIEVVPAGNGQTLSARLTIYSDHERVTIDGIDKNQPTVVAASSDGLQHDASLADGDVYKRTVTANGEAWVSATTGKVVPVTK
jgi:hypothetical protein